VWYVCRVGRVIRERLDQGNSTGHFDDLSKRGFTPQGKGLQRDGEFVSPLRQMLWEKGKRTGLGFIGLDVGGRIWGGTQDNGGGEPFGSWGLGGGLLEGAEVLDRKRLLIPTVGGKGTGRRRLIKSGGLWGGRNRKWTSFSPQKKPFWIT